MCVCFAYQSGSQRAVQTILLSNYLEGRVLACSPQSFRDKSGVQRVIKTDREPPALL